MINYSIETKKIIETTKPSKHNPIYDASMYWSQKSFNLASAIIELYTKKNEIVFDPFLGSGVTLIESISNSLNRRCIGCEINEEPIFMIRSSLQRDNNKKKIERLRSFVKDLQELQHKYYHCVCPICGNSSIIKSIIFDKVNNEVVIKTVNATCPQHNTVKINPTTDILRQMFCRYEYNSIINAPLITNTKLAVREGMHIKDIFTDRNFKVLDEIIGLKKSKYSDIENVIDYVLIGIIHLCKITDTHSNSQWPLWTPSKDCVEKNVIFTFERRAKKVESALRYASEHYSRSYEASSFKNMLRPCGYLIHHKGIQNITDEDIQNESVDFILTDPPYLGQVAYSEYMQLYKPFLGLDFNLEDEIVVSSSPERDKSTTSYFELLDSAFKVCSNKLKSGKYMCMYFHDCSLDVWCKLVEILKKNHFKYISQAHVDKLYTLKNIISPKKSLNGDSLLIFRKELEYGQDEIACKENISEIEQNIILEAKHMISRFGPQSTPELYDNGLMEIIITNGWLIPLSKKYKSLVELFEKYLIWDTDSARWKAKSTS